MAQGRFTGMLRLVHSVKEDDPGSGDIDDQALAWIVRLSSGDADAQDHAAFRAWRDASPERLEALRRSRALWLQLGCSIEAIEQRRRQHAPPRIRNIPWGAIAAILLFCFSFALIWQIHGQYDHVTARGQRLTFALEDGTRVTMSGNTAIKIDSMRGVRRVHVARGEAQFAVNNSASSPFIVTTNLGKFRDIGTVFSVSADGDRSRLIVAEGIVEASHDDQRVVARAGQALSLSIAGIGATQPIDAATALAWTRGSLILKNRSLSGIVEALAPHYWRRIFILSPEAGRQRFTATIDLDHVDDWLDTLDKSTNVRVYEFGGIVFLT